MRDAHTALGETERFDTGIITLFAGIHSFVQSDKLDDAYDVLVESCEHNKADHPFHLY